MTTRYLSTQDAAELAGIGADTFRHYTNRGLAPEPDVIVGLGERVTRGWTEQTIREWMANRPGRGNPRPKPQA